MTRKTRVRQHKRRKPTGGYTEVREHTRNLPENDIENTEQEIQRELKQEKEKRVIEKLKETLMISNDAYNYNSSGYITTLCLAYTNPIPEEIKMIRENLTELEVLYIDKFWKEDLTSELRKLQEKGVLIQDVDLNEIQL